MSVKRRDLIRYLEKNGFYLLREGGKHSIYTNDKKMIPVKRHKQLDRITANELCKQAGLDPKFQPPVFKDLTSQNPVTLYVLNRFLLAADFLKNRHHSLNYNFIEILPYSHKKLRLIETTYTNRKKKLDSNVWIPND